MAFSDVAIVLAGLVGIFLICLMTLLVCERSPINPENVLLLDTFQQYRFLGAGTTPLQDHKPEVGRWIAYTADPRVPTIYVVDNAGYATSELPDALNFSPFTSINSEENELISELRIRLPVNVNELIAGVPMDVLMGFTDNQNENNIISAILLFSRNETTQQLQYQIRTQSSDNITTDSLTKPLRSFQMENGFEFTLFMSVYKGYVQAWLEDKAGGLSVSTITLEPITVYDAFGLSLGFFGGIGKAQVTYCKVSYIHRP